MYDFEISNNSRESIWFCMMENVFCLRKSHIDFSTHFHFQVNDLISNNQLNICSEEKVFVAVLNWLKHDITDRKQHIAEVSEASPSPGTKTF